MNKVAELISDINNFLVEQNNVNKSTVEFLFRLKRKIIELDEQNLSNRQKKIELPVVEVLLRSLGKSSFVQCYEKFKQAASGKLKDMPTAIEDCSGAKTPNSIRTKSSVGLRIFREDLQIEALKIIIAAEKVDQSTRDKALELLQKEREE